MPVFLLGIALRLLTITLLLLDLSHRITAFSTKTNKSTATPSPMDITYDEFAKRLVPRLDEPTQYWVAIAGGPGSGKTTSAEAVATKLNALRPNSCLVLPMDGFHYSKEKLKELDPPNGDEYLRRRGAPWTFDAELCVKLLTQAKKNKGGLLPWYDRSISDPVSDGVELLPEHKVVLVEGLYVMLKHDKRWAPLDDLWNEKWFVKAPTLAIQRQRLIDRSLKTWSQAKADVWGPGVQGVTARVDANDSQNMEIVAPCEAYADLLIETI